jgi:hypothetical protein
VPGVGISAKDSLPERHAVDHSKPKFSSLGRRASML